MSNATSNSNSNSNAPASRRRSVCDPETHFEILRSDSPVSVDGVPLGAPTGDCRCLECGAEAANVDEIPHAADCDQRWTRSRWWRSQITAQ